MSDLRGLVGLAAIIGLAFLLSEHKGQINSRTVAVGLAFQIGFAVLVLRWSVGNDVLDFVAGQVTALVDYTSGGTDFLFGPVVADREETIFAFQVLPVIVFLGALIGMLFYLGVIQWVTEILGGAISWLLKTSKVESLYASTVIFFGQSEAPLIIKPYLSKLTRSELYAVMTGGFASVAGSTWSATRCSVPYLLAASVMSAPASLYMAKLIVPETEESPTQGTVRAARDEKSVNVIDATANGALNGGKIAVIVGALLIAFISLIALANGLLSGAGEIVGIDDLTFPKLLG